MDLDNLPTAYFGPADNAAALVNSRLLSKRAEELGFVVSDEAIREFLAELTGDKVTRDQMSQLISDNVTPSQLFDYLRPELFSARLQNLSLQGAWNSRPQSAGNTSSALSGRRRSSWWPCPRPTSSTTLPTRPMRN